MSELRKLAEYCSKFNINDAPEKVIIAAKNRALDYIGVAIGACNYEEIPQIIKESKKWAKGCRERLAAVWGSGYKAPVLDAAMIIGIMGHALELDDGNQASKTHTGAVVIPAAWVLADAMGCNGKQFIQAVVVGYDALCRIGQGFDMVSHRKRGWHVTGTAGIFGSAAAAANLLGLNTEKTLNAFGLAGTQSSGLWAFLADGASCKKLHTGKAAAGGIQSAILARAGMTGPEHILTAEDGGLYRAMSDTYDISRVCAELGTRYDVTMSAMKVYPSCRSTHYSIDAALEIREENDFCGDDIESVEVETGEIAVMQCGSQIYPDLIVEAKFSIPFVTAIAFYDNKVTLGQFTPEHLNRPEIRSLAERVIVRIDKEFTDNYPKIMGCRMTVHLRNGNTIEKTVNASTGTLKRPLTPKQQSDKFISLTEPIIGKGRSIDLIDMILNIEKYDKLPDLSFK